MRLETRLRKELTPEISSYGSLRTIVRVPLRTRSSRWKIKGILAGSRAGRMVEQTKNGVAHFGSRKGDATKLWVR